MRISFGRWCSVKGSVLVSAALVRPRHASCVTSGSLFQAGFPSQRSSSGCRCCPRFPPSGDVNHCALHTASWHHTFGSFCWLSSWLADSVLIEKGTCVYLCLFICVLLADDKAGAELDWLNTTISLPFSFFSTSLCTRGNHGCLLSFLFFFMYSIYFLLKKLKYN